MAKLRDYRRVIGFSQLLYLAGRGLKRQGIKYTTIAGVLAVGVMATQIIGERIADIIIPVNPLKAILLPGVIALLTFGLGNGLIGLSNLFSAEKLLIADANSMNLMEDRKKADIAYHLEILWERVFKYESALRHDGEISEETARISTNRDRLASLVGAWPAECKAHFGINEEDLDEFIGYIAQFRPLSTRMETSREGFIASASFALKNSLPQKLQQALTGFDFSLIEDWYDGAFFTSNDCKLKEQYAAHKVIRGIRSQVGIAPFTRLKEALSGHTDPLWHSLTMKKIGMKVGSMINRLNKQYVPKTDPSYFDAQDFLWKDRQADEMILADFGPNRRAVLQDLQTSRRNMIREIFSSRKEEAHNQINRIFGRDFINALELRMDYDVEFGTGLLDYNPINDIDELERLMMGRVYPLGKAQKKISQAKDNLKMLDAFLESRIPELYQRPLELRAARIGFHLNRFNIQKMIREEPAKAVDIFQNYIIKAEKRYSKRVCLLRQHYELARIQLFSYVRMVDDLGEYN